MPLFMSINKKNKKPNKQRQKAPQNPKKPTKLRKGTFIYSFRKTTVLKC